MNSWARISAGTASRTRAWLNLTLLKTGYARALTELPTITGPAIVVGSAPEPHRPEGLRDDWFVISVNASQITAEHFGLHQPDLTLFRDNILVPGEHQDAVWKALRGKRTTHAVATMGSSENQGFAEGIAARDYHADRATELNRHIRGAIIVEMSGLYHVSLTAGVSNGIFAALLALKLGASQVIMSGFSFIPGWYFAKDIPGFRGHIPADKAVCQAMVDRNYPVFTSDPDFAKNSGLRLWTGSAS